MNDNEREEFTKACQHLWEQIIETNAPRELVQQCISEVIDEEILRDLRAAADRADQGAKG